MGCGVLLLVQDAAAIQREEILTRMKQEREAAKQSSNLRSLRYPYRPFLLHLILLLFYFQINIAKAVKNT
jgi:hypothetical protein